MRLNKRMRTDIRMQETQYRSLRNSQYRFAIHPGVLAGNGVL
ncbi:MAG: hypothetical protein ABIL39_02790 [candidate division WOR-3 bacterium]